MQTNNSGRIDSFINSVSKLNQNRNTSNNNSQTTNHIYLHPGPNQGEFDNWMRRIGSLLQVADEHTALKQVLELITAVFEPQRLFLINHPPLPELNVEAYTEILVVMDRSQITSKKITKGILDMACFRQQHVVINFETAAKFERAINQGHPHYCLLCSEENLVFSGSSYRLQSPSAETLDELKTELSERLGRLFPQVDIFLLEANRLKDQSSNLTALMLHHCLAYFYRNILFLYTHKFYNTHRLAKLHSNIARFFPQIYFLLNEGSIKALDDTNKWLTAPLYPVDEIWDTEGVFEEVGMALKVAKAVIEKQKELLIGGSHNLEQSENSERTKAKKKSVE